jgi:hypothetical protein
MLWLQRVKIPWMINAENHSHPRKITYNYYMVLISLYETPIKLQKNKIIIFPAKNL